MANVPRGYKEYTFVLLRHLSSRQTVGSPVRMQLVTMPESEKEEGMC